MVRPRRRSIARTRFHTKLLESPSLRHWYRVSAARHAPSCLRCTTWYAVRAARPRLVRVQRTYSSAPPGQAALRLRCVRYAGGRCAYAARTARLRHSMALHVNTASCTCVRASCTCRGWSARRRPHAGARTAGRRRPGCGRAARTPSCTSGAAGSHSCSAQSAGRVASAPAVPRRAAGAPRRAARAAVAAQAPASEGSGGRRARRTAGTRRTCRTPARGAGVSSACAAREPRRRRHRAGRALAWGGGREAPSAPRTP
eukprot:scaffold66847_cov57-Phaeocystis_antarctica.AAC.1